MKRLAICALGVALLSSLAAMAPVGGSNAQDAEGMMRDGSEAAFHDGLFHGRRAVQRGESLRLSSGRWSRDTDRRAFVAGYLQAYVRNGGTETVATAQAAEKAAYREGLEDGGNARENGEAFQVLRKIKHQGSIEAEQAYRMAYSTGYQMAYYAAENNADALMIRPILSAN